MTTPELHREIAWCDGWMAKYGAMAERESDLLERRGIGQGWLDTYLEKSKLLEEIARAEGRI